MCVFQVQTNTAIDVFCWAPCVVLEPLIKKKQSPFALFAAAYILPLIGQRTLQLFYFSESMVDDLLKDLMSRNTQFV